LHLQDVTTGTEIKTLDVPSASLDFSNSNYVTTCAGYYDTVVHSWNSLVSVYDIAEGSLVRTFRKDNSVFGFKTDRGGTFVAAVGNNPSLAIWSLQDTTQLYVSPDNIFASRLDISQDGSLIAVTGHSVYLVRSSDGVVSRRLSGTAPNGFLVVAFSRDGRKVAASGFGEETCWDALTGNTIIDIVHMEPYPATVQAVALNDDYIFSGDETGKINVWSIRHANLFAVLAGHAEGIFKLSLSADGTKLFSLAFDKMNVWSLTLESAWHPTNR
jgi:hypothetical protein